MGRAVALRLSYAGASVVVNDLSAEAAEATAVALRDAGGQGIAVSGNVTSSSDVPPLWTVQSSSSGVFTYS